MMQTLSDQLTEWPIHPLVVNPVLLDKWLSRFAIEIRRTDGKPYPTNTLYNISCGLSHHIRETRPDISIFSESCYSFNGGIYHCGY